MQFSCAVGVFLYRMLTVNTTDLSFQYFIIKVLCLPAFLYPMLSIKFVSFHSIIISITELFYQFKNIFIDTFLEVAREYEDGYQSWLEHFTLSVECTKLKMLHDIS
jgi:hypothetical protein